MNAVFILLLGLLLIWLVSTGRAVNMFDALTGNKTQQRNTSSITQ